MPASVKYVSNNGILYRTYNGGLIRTKSPQDIKAAQNAGVWPIESSI
jgi:hypothetical protein